MAKIEIQALKGLRSLGELSNEEREKFLSDHAAYLSKYASDPIKYKIAADRMYENQKFINNFGQAAFDKLHDGTEAAFNLRNSLTYDKIRAEADNEINDKFIKWGSPFKADGTRDNSKGLGTAWEKASQLSPESKLKLMESGYIRPPEFEKFASKAKIPSTSDFISKAFGDGTVGKAVKNIWDQTALFNPLSSGDLFTNIAQEATVQYLRENNDKILQDLYNSETDNAADKLEDQVVSSYYSPQIANLTDDQVKKSFIKAIYGDRNKGDLGIPEYASHYGNGTENDISKEMKDFSIDDMRQVLAKRQAYYANMNPEMAANALNNEAKRYITERQSGAYQFGLFLLDTGISTLSYTADKINGITEIGRTIKDLTMDAPIVMIDDNGEIIDPNKTPVAKGRNGSLYYQDKQGQVHSVYKRQISYSALHQMGKNEDGSNIEGAFGIDFLTTNPKYWTRAEQFKTLDENEQKQYEKIGSSPYQVSYNPGDDSHLWYESFKMMSFGLADKGLELLPWGIGKIGKGISTMSKLGKVATGFGKALDTTGRFLSQSSKTGQFTQGLIGAGGIAYAYGRGTYQETLQKNLANAEQTVTELSKSQIYKQYHENKEYKANVDKLINARAASMKAEYMAQMKKDGNSEILDTKAINEMFYTKAQQEVLGELLQQKIQENKASEKYADLQQEAINRAGRTATITFYPEAVKYGFVNSMGFRKYLFTSSGTPGKVSSTLKRLREVTTSEGRKRLAIDVSKSLTAGSKWKNFGKTVASQAWGGAWTNGTDDMQVDAAERINEDSFNNYLKAYQSGRALADTYGFADGMYSYMMGLGNSMGQETTWKAATVGALGSVVSFSPQFANITRLATKQGREAYKNNFGKEVVRDKNGVALRNEDGTIKYKDISRWSNLGEQLNYFVTNGVLNTYYGSKQSVKDLQYHADYVNNLLDNYDDFKAIEHLVASNIASENVVNVGDKKTIDFIRAINAINALETLGNDKNDPATMSSVVQNAKALIEKASHLNDKDNNPFSKEEIDNLLAQYYASNPGIEQSDTNNQKALEEIAKNAQKLMEATDAFNNAEEEIQKIEKNKKESIDPEVRARLKLQQALDGHWKERKKKMQSELDDSSSDEPSTEANTVIASVGGRRNALALVKAYDQQKAEIEKDIEEQKKDTEKAQKDYQEAVEKEAAAKEKGDSQAILDAQNETKEARAALEASQQRERYAENLLAESEKKKNTLKVSMENAEVEESNERVTTAQETLDIVQKKLDAANEKRSKWVDENGKAKKRHGKQVENISKEIQDLESQKKLAQEELERSKEKVLSADEIFSLDPVTRARMMNKDNRSQYSKEQQSEIEKLEKQLIMKDADALQKVQDIGLLTQRINQNADAYNRIAQNPEAAANEFENQRVLAADAAYKMVDYRNAELASEFLNDYLQGSKKDPSITEDDRKQVVYRTLRKLNSNILNNIETNNMLPEYQSEIQGAKVWRGTVDDISAVISNAEQSDAWKNNISQNIDYIANISDTKEDLLKNLEKAIDDMPNTNAAKDLDYVLKGLERLGYQRDATVIENRKQRIEREEKARKEIEEKKKKIEEETKKAGEKKAEEDKKKEEEKKKKGEENIFEDAEEPKVDMSENIDEESIKAIAEATGKSEEEVKRAIAELRAEHNKEKYKGWGAPSTALGNTADIMVRDFFAGELKESYPNITKEVMQHFIKQLEDFKKDLDSKGIHIVSKEVMAHGVITTTDNEGREHKLAVAGTLDLFGYDDKGNYYIYDMKTTRNHGKDKLVNEKAKWSRQVSLYADLLSQTYGIKIDPNRLQIIPINVYYPTPKGDGKYENPTGPEYSVDKKTSQLKMTDNSGKTSSFVQDNTKDFEMRSTKSGQYKPGYTKADINWDMLPSTVYDVAEHNGEMEVSTVEEASEAPEEVVKEIVKDTQDFTLSQDENYYYVKDKKTGKEVRYARVTTVISADRSVPVEQQWQPTNEEVMKKLTGKTSSEIEEMFNKQEAENVKPSHEVAKDGSNVTSLDPSTIVDKDASKAEQIGTVSGVWNAGILMEDEYGDGTIDAGEIPTVDDAGDVHKSKLTVERKGNKITFAADKESMALDITPEEYEHPVKEDNKKESKENSHIATRKREKVGTGGNKVEVEVENKSVRFEDLKPGDQFLDNYGYDYIFIKRTKDNEGRDVVLIKDYNGNTRPIAPFISGSMHLIESNNNQFDRIVPNTSTAKDSKEKNEDSNNSRVEDKPFKATSMEKKDGEWYFNGSYAGENETTQVKAKDNFDLDAAIERQISNKESGLIAQGYDIENKNIVDDGENVQGHSLTIEEQAEGSTEVHQTSDSDTMDSANTTGNNEIESKGGTLKANAMSEYEPSALEREGKLVHKKGAKPNDSMNQYYAWMKAAGIKLQNIIDSELANIIKLNPHAKVKFMLVNPAKNATNDVAMQSFLMLVLDYDNSINKGITRIHDDNNGGVIESNGKKYLVVGTAGYGKQNAEIFENFKRLMDTGRKGGFELKVKRKQFFDNHPNERFYVNEDLSTEVVPYSQIPGYIVKQREGEEQKDRSVLELFKDKGLSLKDAAFGIQQRKGFILKGASIDDVMIPRNRDRNTGNAFVLAPASNGKLVPIYLKVLKYNEMKEGELSKKVDNLLYDLTSSDYTTRLNAVKELSKIFYLDTKDNDILLRKHNNELSFVIGGKVDSRSFTIDANTDRNALKELFKNKMLEMNPIVNITMNVLSSSSLLKQYDEAGALMTDAAFLGTAGSSYSVYGIDSNGKMMIPTKPNTENPNAHDNSDYRKIVSQVIFGNKYYTTLEDKFYLDGKEITDEKTINQLQYLKRILDSKLSPVENKGAWNYYILSEGDHPEVVKVNKNSKEVKETTEDQAKELIKRVKEKEEKQRREAAAQKALEDALNREPTNTEEVNLGDTQDFIVDPETGELLDPETGEVISSERNNGNTKKEEKKETLEGEQNVLPNVAPSAAKGSTQSFGELHNMKKYKMKIGITIKKKWPSAPKDVKGLTEFLRIKDIEVDNIGTTEEDIKAWIKTLEDCR